MRSLWMRNLSALWCRFAAWAVNLAPMRRHCIAVALMRAPGLVPSLPRMRGIRWPVFPLIESTWSIPFGVKDRGPQAALLRLLDDADAFIDCGANLGWYSCLAARRNIRRILAVEPVPSTARMLRRIGKWNGFHRFEVLQAAVGIARGTARFSIPSTRFPEMGGFECGLPEKRTIDVSVETLNDIIDRIEPECRNIAVKVDVEGHELAVMEAPLDPCSERRVCAVMIEVHLSQMDDPLSALDRLAACCARIGAPRVMVPDDPAAGPLLRLLRNATRHFPLVPLDNPDLREDVAARRFREVYLIATRKTRSI